MQTDRRRNAFAYIAGFIIVLAYFVYFVRPGLHVHFADDDPMNMYYYWSRGPWALVRGLLLFFTTYNRPLGGVFYLTLYRFFGLNPLPYHIAITCFLLCNVWLVYRFVSRISGSPLLAGLCALIVVYHGQMAALVYLPSFIYDVLCFTFYFLAFNYYLSIRTRNVLLSKWQIVAFLLLAIAALDAKEMAVTLPVMVLLYEAIWHPPASWRWPRLLDWARREALPPLVLGLLTAVYIVGKNVGSDALRKMSAYQSEFTWSRYFESTTRFLNTFFYRPFETGFFHAPAAVLLLVAVLLLIAWRRREKHFWFACLFVAIAPLPITFLPGRGVAQLYIPLFGWALIVATVFLWLCGLVAKAPLLRKFPAAVLTVLVLLGVALLWRVTAHEDPRAAFEKEGRVTWALMQDFRALRPPVKPGSRIVVLDDVFYGWKVCFIGELTIGDHSVHVWLQKKTPFPPAEIEKMDYILTIRDDRLVCLKPAAG
jgi:hypothetical protein